MKPLTSGVMARRFEVSIVNEVLITDNKWSRFVSAIIPKKVKGDRPKWRFGNIYAKSSVFLFYLPSLSEENSVRLTRSGNVPNDRHVRS